MCVVTPMSSADDLEPGGKTTMEGTNLYGNLNNLLNEFPDGMYQSMCLNLKNLFLSRPGCAFMTLATLCAGCELALPVFDIFAMLMGLHFGVSFEVLHCFSCERDRKLQTWIREHFNPLYIFPDVTQIYLPLAFDILSQRLQPVDSPDVAVCGWSCVDNSAANVNRAKKRRVIEQRDPTSETSRTAWGLLLFMETKRPRVVIGENTVDSTTRDEENNPSNLEFFVHQAGLIGYLVFTLFLHALRFCAPHDRKRMYIVAFAVETLTNVSLTRSLQDAAETFARTVILPTKQLCDYMLADDDPRVRRWLAWMKQSTVGDRRSSTQTKWHTKHKRFMEQHGYDWPQEPPEAHRATLEQLRGFLGERVYDLLVCLYTIDSPRWSGGEVVVQTLHSIDRSRPKSDAAPCLMPCGFPYAMKRGRPFTPEECYLLQDFDLDASSINICTFDQGDLTYRDHMRAAGNAFNGTCLGLALMLAWAHST